MTLFIAQLQFILYNWRRWMMFHPKHVWLNNMNFKNIVWFIKAILLYMHLSIWTSICLSICLFIRVFIHSFIYLSVCLSFLPYTIYYSISSQLVSQSFSDIHSFIHSIPGFLHSVIYVVICLVIHWLDGCIHDSSCICSFDIFLGYLGHNFFLASNIFIFTQFFMIVMHI